MAQDKKDSREHGGKYHNFYVYATYKLGYLRPIFAIRIRRSKRAGKGARVRTGQSSAVSVRILSPNPHSSIQFRPCTMTRLTNSGRRAMRGGVFS